MKWGDNAKEFAFLGCPPKNPEKILGLPRVWEILCPKDPHFGL